MVAKAIRASSRVFQHRLGYAAWYSLARRQAGMRLLDWLRNWREKRRPRRECRYSHEADGGLALWEEILRRGLFDRDLAGKANRSLGGWFEWPPAGPGPAA